jgi:hypothetical protein
MYPWEMWSLVAESHIFDYLYIKEAKVFDLEFVTIFEG